MVAESMQNAHFLRQVKENAPNDVFGIENKCEAHFSVLFTTKRNRVSRLSDEAKASRQIHGNRRFWEFALPACKTLRFPKRVKNFFSCKKLKFFHNLLTNSLKYANRINTHIFTRRFCYERTGNFKKSRSR